MHPLHAALNTESPPDDLVRLWAAQIHYFRSCLPRKNAHIVSKCAHTEAAQEWCRCVLGKADAALSEWLALAGGACVLTSTEFACEAYISFCAADWREGMCAGLADVQERLAGKYPKPAFGEDPGCEMAAVDAVAHSAGEGVGFKQKVVWAILDGVWSLWIREASPPPELPADTTHTLSSVEGAFSVALETDKTRRRVVVVNCSPDFLTHWTDLQRKVGVLDVACVLLTDARFENVAGLPALCTIFESIELHAPLSVIALLNESNFLPFLNAGAHVSLHYTTAGTSLNVDDLKVKLLRGPPCGVSYTPLTCDSLRLAVDGHDLPADQQSSWWTTLVSTLRSRHNIFAMRNEAE